MFFNYKLLHDFVWCSMVCFMWQQTCTLHPEFLSLPSKRWQAHGISNQQPMRYLVGGFNHLETYESQVGWLFAIYGTIKHVQNHQPVCRFQVEWQLLYRDRLQSPILPLGQWWNQCSLSREHWFHRQIHQLPPLHWKPHWLFFKSHDFWLHTPDGYQFLVASPSYFIYI